MKKNYFAALVVVQGTDNHILAINRRNTGKYGFPGGKIDPGEAPRTAACRELFEETGLVVSPESLVEIFESDSDSGRLTITFLATEWSGELAPSEEGLIAFVDRDTLIGADTSAYPGYNTAVFAAIDRRKGASMTNINLSPLFLPAVKVVENTKNLVPGLKTWHIESTFVFALLAVVAIYRWQWSEVVGGLGVWIGFMSDQVVGRMTEREAARSEAGQSDVVECYPKYRVYYWAQQLLWTLYFLSLGAFAALTSVGIFLVWPFWRKAYRKYHPQQKKGG